MKRKKRPLIPAGHQSNHESWLYSIHSVRCVHVCMCMCKKKVFSKIGNWFGYINNSGSNHYGLFCWLCYGAFIITNTGIAFTVYKAPFHMSQFICSFSKCILNTSHVQGSHKHQKYKAERENNPAFKELGLGGVRKKQPHSWVYKTMWEVPWKGAMYKGKRADPFLPGWCGRDQDVIGGRKLNNMWTSRGDTFWEPQVIAGCDMLSWSQ